MTLRVSTVLATALTLGLAAPAALAEDAIKIGGIFSISGPAAPFGIPERDTVEIIAKDINARGGINGRLVEVAFCDDKTNPTESARCASELIRQEGVVAIIGSTIGTGTLALLPLAARAEVPVLAPVSTIAVTDPTSETWPWAFRISLNDQIMLTETLDRLVFGPGHKRIAVLYQEDAYGEAGMKLAQEIADKSGSEVVSAVSAPLTAIDLSSAAAKIRSSEPDVILLQVSAPALGASFVRAARQVGLDVPIVGAGSLAQQPFIDAAGPSGNGVRVLAIANWETPTEKQRELATLLTAAGKTPTGFAEFLGSNGMMILAEALRKIDGEVTGAAIRDAMETVCDFDGTFMSGTVCFSADQHDGLGGDVMITVEIQDGKFVTVE